MAALVAEAPPHMLRMQVQPAQPLRILSGGLAGQVNSHLASRDSGQGCVFCVSWPEGMLGVLEKSPPFQSPSCAAIHIAEACGMACTLYQFGLCHTLPPFLAAPSPGTRLHGAPLPAYAGGCLPGGYSRVNLSRQRGSHHRAV